MPADDLAQRRQVVDLGHLNHPLVPASEARLPDGSTGV